MDDNVHCAHCRCYVLSDYGHVVALSASCWKSKGACAIEKRLHALMACTACSIHCFALPVDVSEKAKDGPALLLPRYPRKNVAIATERKYTPATSSRNNRHVFLILQEDAVACSSHKSALSFLKSNSLWAFDFYACVNARPYWATSMRAKDKIVDAHNPLPQAYYSVDDVSKDSLLAGGYVSRRSRVDTRRVPCRAGRRRSARLSTCSFTHSALRLGCIILTALRSLLT
jgi:hypothetical protein